MYRTMIVLLTVGLSGCETDESGEKSEIPDGATIIAIGDSVMEWNAEKGASIPDVIGEKLNRVVYNAAVSGALFVDGDAPDDSIAAQYVDGDWEWLVLDGGGNDVNEECGCGQCDEVLDGIISTDAAAGALPGLVDQAVASGVRVVLLGYYEIPPTGEYGFADCNPIIEQLSSRLAALAETSDDVLFVDGRDVFDSSELENYDDDHVHPSELGSERIGQAIAERILAAEQ